MSIQKPKSIRINLKKSLIGKGIEKVQRIRNERARNNYFLNVEKEYLNAEKGYRDAKKLSERYENEDRAFKDNEPTFEHCETLRTLIIKGRERATIEIEEITAGIGATKEEIKKILKT